MVWYINLYEFRGENVHGLYIYPSWKAARWSFFLVSHLGTYVVSAHAQTRTNSTHAHHTPLVHERTYNYTKTLFINSC